MRRISRKKGLFLKLTPFVLALIMAITWNNYHKSSMDKSTMATVNVGENGISVHFIDVSQGDCELILDNGSAILIDAGEKEQGVKVEKYLKSLGITKIDMLVGTHPHVDHIGSIARQLEVFEVKNLMLPQIPKDLMPTTACYYEMLEAANRKGVDIVWAKKGLSYKFGKGELKVLGPKDKRYENLNLYSIPIKYTYFDNSFLMCGDLEKEAELDLIESGQDISADVFKVNHHGSSTSNCADFLKTVGAKYYVIEVGKGNKYDLPNKSVMNRLKTKPIYRTDFNGDIVFISDGKNLDIKPKKGGAITYNGRSRA